jgi:hypothetical protein
MSPLGEFPLLPRGMMRLGRMRARFTFLWLLLFDPRLLSSDPRIVWPNVPKGSTMVTCRLALFVGMLFDRFCKFKVSILTKNKVLTSLRYMSPMGRDIFSRKCVFTTALFESILFISRLLGF